MSNENWTKGEWEIGDCNNQCCEVSITNQRGECSTICLDRLDRFTAGFIMERSEMLANAHLIAAAPELYKELKYAEEILREVAKVSGLTHIDVESCTNMATKALAKARGEL